MPSKHTIALIIIVALAVFFRFWQFGSIPPGLYQDEAMNGADALASLNSGEYKVFYANNNGREGMIVWLDALAVQMFGTEPWVLRLFPALAGVLAILGLYFLTKELFSVEIALASSFFMAMSFWAVNFSRMGFRAGLMVPFLIWSFYFLIHGYNSLKSDFKNPRSRTSVLFFLIAGILFGLGFYTYISYRFAPFLLLIFFIPYLLKYSARKYWLGFLIFAVTTFIVALPIGIYFFNNPGDFFGRSGQVSVFLADNPLRAAALSIAATLGMFNIVGDFNWRHNFAGSPQLFFPVGILFLLGIYLSVKEVRLQKSPKSDFGSKFILIWFFIFLLPNILSAEGNPHALRALGAMPMVMIFAGIGLIWLYKKFQGYKKEVFWLLIVFLIFIVGSEFNKYFVRWASNIRTAEAFSQNQVIISDYLNKLPSSVKKYVVWPSNDRPANNGLPVSAQTVYFLTTKKTEINYLKSDELDKIKLGKNGAVVAPLYFDLNLLHSLNKQLPQSRINFIHINTAVVEIP